MGFGASLPLLQHSLNDVRKWDTRKGCVCAPLFSCHQHSFGKVFPPPALFVFVYSKLCLDLSFVFQTIKMCVCESFHLCLWIFTFVFVNLYTCVCESFHLCLWIFTFVFVNLYPCKSRHHISTLSAQPSPPWMVTPRKQDKTTFSPLRHQHPYTICPTVISKAVSSKKI